MPGPRGPNRGSSTWKRCSNCGRFDELRDYAATHAQDLLLSDGLPLEARETAKLWAVAGA